MELPAQPACLYMLGFSVVHSKPSPWMLAVQSSGKGRGKKPCRALVLNSV